MPLTRAACAAPLAGSSPSRSGSPRPPRRATKEADVVSESRIAYLSMEIALHPAMPTYSGGLGMRKRPPQQNLWVCDPKADVFSGR